MLLLEPRAERRARRLRRHVGHRSGREGRRIRAVPHDPAAARLRRGRHGWVRAGRLTLGVVYPAAPRSLARPGPARRGVPAGEHGAQEVESRLLAVWWPTF